MDELYDVLETIYRWSYSHIPYLFELKVTLAHISIFHFRDWLEMFKPTTFHVGGDEVQ